VPLSARRVKPTMWSNQRIVQQHHTPLSLSCQCGAGKRRYDRKQSGYGGQTKPVFHKKVSFHCLITIVAAGAHVHLCG